MICGTCLGDRVVYPRVQFSEDSDGPGDVEEMCEDCAGTGHVLCGYCDGFAYRYAQKMWSRLPVCAACDACDELFTPTTAVLLLAMRLGPMRIEERRAA